MKNTVAVLFDGVVKHIFVGSEQSWSSDHMARFPGASFVFTDQKIEIDDIYDQETQTFKKIFVEVKVEEVAPQESQSEPE